MSFNIRSVPEDWIYLDNFETDYKGIDKVYEHATYTAKVHYGKYDANKNTRLSKHLELKDFVRKGYYGFAEQTINYLETMFYNFKRLDACGFNSTLRGDQLENPFGAISESSHHTRGCAVDVRMLYANGYPFDARKIAIAAVVCGFGGVMPLECLELTETSAGFTDTAHLDIRYDTRNVTLYGWERRTSDGSYGCAGSFNAPHNEYKCPDGFYARYGFTEEQIKKDLGYYEVFDENMLFDDSFEETVPIKPAPAPPATTIKYTIESIKINKIATTHVDLRVTLSSEANLKIKYKQINEETFKTVVVTDKHVDIKLTGLTPGTDYKYSFDLLDTADKRVATSYITFHTEQDFLLPPKILSFTHDPVQSTYDALFKLTYNNSSSINNFWYNYWKKRDSVAKHSGLWIHVIKNGRAVQIINAESSNGSFELIPSDFNMSVSDCLQLGVQSWIDTEIVLDNAKVKHAILTSEITYSEPVLLTPELQKADHVFVKVGKFFNEVVAYFNFKEL